VKENAGASLPSAGRKADVVDHFVLKAMRDAARRNAGRLARTLGLTTVEVEDAEQDILLQLIERWKHFDPSRGPWSHFANMIARQAAQLVADRIVTQRKAFSVVGSTGQTSDEESENIVEFIADRMAWSETDILTASSYRNAICRLPPRQRVLAAAALAADGELADVRKALRMSSSEFYRQVDQLRTNLGYYDLLDPQQIVSFVARRRRGPGSAARGVTARNPSPWESFAPRPLQEG
jgi:hypothetical protein